VSTVEVVVPSYRRPALLGDCLDGLARQTRPPDRVLVVVRLDDAATRSMLAEREPDLPVEVVDADQPGVVHALNRALDRLTGEVVAIFDDDTVADPQWLERAIGHLDSDPALVGVGGRDRLVDTPDAPGPPPRPVGSIDWWGRMNGFHDLGVEPGPVELLKGCCMAFRRAPIADLRFDTRLLGAGAQVHNDAAFSLAASRRGPLRYDPELVVDHHHGPRWDRDQRAEGPYDGRAWRHRVHNETLTLLEHLPAGRATVYLLWAHLVGTRDNVGLLQALRLTGDRGRDAWRALVASQLGRLQGMGTWARRGRR
jgi:GT2 family glycosyltransferase